jgi:hypothetical protein
MIAGTIVTPDHLPRARVLARSLSEHHPGGRLVVLVLGPEMPAGEPFDVLAPEALGVPALEELLAGYGPMELACSLKPWLLMHLLREHPAALYLDSDMRVYAPLDAALDQARRHGLVLTRHLHGPLPRDGRLPSEQEILLAGTYNAGFVGAGRDGMGFLRWWADRLAEDCRVEPARGLFADQRWLDLAPGIAPDAHLSRDPGLNLGFWDLPNRPVEAAEDGHTVRGRPLRLFHFGAFDPERPDVLSRHQDRIDPAEHPALAALLRDYSRELLAAGHAAAAATARATATPLMRRLSREGRAGGALREPPGTAAAEAELLRWLQAPGARGGWAGVTRYLVALHEIAPELQRQFPDLDGPDGLDYADWARAHAGKHPELPAELAPAPVTLPDGRPFDPDLRALFHRSAVPLADFLDWLREPAPQGAEAGVTRYLYEIHRSRPDVRAAIPVAGPELVAWARASGVREYPLLGELLYASSDRAGAGSLA